MTDLTFTRKGRWSVNGTAHDTSVEALEDAANQALASPGTTIIATPPQYAVVCGTPSTTTPVSPPPPSTDPTDPPPATGTGGHPVVATITDGADVPWVAQATVDDDPAAPAIFVRFAKADGTLHENLVAHFYAHCFDVGARLCSGAHAHLGCRLAVTYDGAAVPIAPSSNADGTVDFWRGCAFTVRYGAQTVPDPARIDKTLLPALAFGQPTSYDDSQCDYSFNGRGCPTTNMATTGDHNFIGYLPEPGIAYVCDPTPENWAVVRRYEDHDGVWSQSMFCDEAGRIIDVTKYPQASVLAAAQRGGQDAQNPIVPYAGAMRGTTLTPPTNTWDVGGGPFIPNGAHLYGFSILAAMMTGDARDRDHLAMWANWPLLEINPSYTASGGVMLGAQRRAAWCLRQIFCAAYLSSETAYFQAQLDRNLAIINAVDRNALGELVTSTPYGASNANIQGGYAGIAMWMQSYLVDVLSVVALKQTGWAPIRDWLLGWYIRIINSPHALLATVYAWVVKDPSGAFIGDWDAQITQTCLANYFTADEAAQVVAATTVQQVYDLYVAMLARRGKTTAEKCVNNVADFTVSGPTNYGAEVCMAVIDAYNVGLPGADKALAYVQALPTPIDYSGNRKFERVTRGT